MIFIMAISLFVFSSLLIFRDLSNFMIGEVRNKVDVSVYFKKNTEEEEILVAKKEITKFSPKIKEVEYVSAAEARENFVEKHKSDPLYLDALEEVGNNPFLPALNIKSEDPDFYAQISEFLTQGPFKDSVEKVSYFENKKVIDKLFLFTSQVKKAGIALNIFLIILVFLITFNTVKLTIFSSKEEISTMKLVGASDWFIRGPFIIQGILYGLTSLVIVDILFLAFFGFFGEGLAYWFFGFDFLEFFQNNLFSLLLWQIIFAVVLGVFSSILAVRKYLKI